MSQASTPAVSEVGEAPSLNDRLSTIPEEDSHAADTDADTLPDFETLEAFASAYFADLDPDDLRHLKPVWLAFQDSMRPDSCEDNVEPTKLESIMITNVARPSEETLYMKPSDHLTPDHVDKYAHYLASNADATNYGKPECFDQHVIPM